MANEYIVIKHDVTARTCCVLAQLKLSDIPGCEPGPTYRIYKQAGTTNYELNAFFKEGTTFTVKGERPVIGKKVYETLVVKSV